MKKETTDDFIKRKNEQFQREKELGTPIGMKDIGRKGRFYYLREAWTFLPQTDLRNDKVFIFERLNLHKQEGELAYGTESPGKIEYRFCYFIRGKIGWAENRWVWGQFCPLIPHEDFIKLIAKAKKEKVIL